MTPVEFRIRFAAPFGFSMDLPTHMEVAVKPKWRVLTIECQRVTGDAYELVIRMHPDDLKVESTSPDELRRFRDTAMAMLAMTAVVPVVPLSKGTFTFPLEGKKLRV